MPLMLGQYAYPTLGTEETLEGTATATINGQPILGIPALIPGNVIDLGVNFTAQGAPVDPSTVTITLQDPTGLITSPPPSHGITGAFAVDILPPYPSGTYIATWTGSGSVIASTGPIEFVVLPA